MATPKQDKNPNVPTLRFPGFTGDWEIKTFREAVKVIKEKIPTTELQSNNYISTENILSNFVGVSDSCNIPSNQIVTRFKRNDILMANIRPYLRKIWHADRDGGCNADVFVFRAVDNSSFVFYSIANDKFCDYVMSGAKGVKMPRGDKEQILKFKLGIPSKKEQEQIAAFLSLLDERIATQSKIIERLESLMKGLNNYLDSIFGNAVKITFGEISNAYNGLSGKSAEDFGSGYPYLSYVQVNGDTEITEPIKDAMVNIGKDENQTVVQRGDLILTLSSETAEEVAVGASYLGEINPIYLNSFCFGMHFTDAKRVFAPYFAYLCKTERFRKWVLPLAQGSTRYNLQKQDFLKKKIQIPDHENQEKIYLLLNRYRAKMCVELSLLNKYKIQKEYLLKKLFI